MKKVMDKIHDMMEESLESYLFVGKVKGMKGGCVAIHGTEADSLVNLKMLWNGVYEEVLNNNDGDKELTDKLMKTVYLSEKELRKEMSEMIRKMIAKATSAPDDDEEDDDDSADETEGEEETGEESNVDSGDPSGDCGVVNIHIHCHRNDRE